MFEGVVDNHTLSLLLYVLNQLKAVGIRRIEYKQQNAA